MRQSHVIVVLALILLGVGLLAGWALSRNGDSPEAYARAADIRQQAEDAHAWRAATLPVRMVLLAAGGGAAVSVAAGLGWAYILHLRNRARTIYPDPGGTMPAVSLRHGETLADLGALAGPVTLEDGRPAYHALPPGAVAGLQGEANRGAATTRTMRAWATHAPAATRPAPLPTPQERPALPPVEVLTGDEAHIIRLLEDGTDD